MQDDQGVEDRTRASEWTEIDDFWAALVECRHGLPAVLRLIARRVVDLLGDGCVVTTVSADGTVLQPSAILHVDPAVERAMRAVLADGGSRIGEGIAGTVAADRRPMLLNDLPPETVAETTPAQFLPFVRDHPMRAMVIVPMVAAGELVGTIGAIRTRSADPYTLADLRLLEALAERAALAVADATAGPRSIGTADFEAIYRHNLDGVLLTTPDGHILAANPAACMILRRTEREIVLGGRDGIVVADDPRLAQALEQRAASGHARAELAMRRGDGSTIIADVSSTIFTTPDNKVRAAVIFRDVTDEVAARERALAKVAELEVAADRDPLTGLWNRRGFAITAEGALAAADAQGSTTQLVFIDVDGLKAVNDALGHTGGDAVIVAVASAIARTIRDVDLACRRGGDEFVVLLADTAATEVPAIVDRIQTEVSTKAPGTTFSTGVVERPPRMEATLNELVDAADRDMYQDKVLRRLGASD